MSGDDDDDDENNKDKKKAYYAKLTPALHYRPDLA